MLLLLNKPHGVICQFSKHDKHPSLAEYIKTPNVYPAGRLDTDSEGLLILTDDGLLQNTISHPLHKKPKTYLVQVEGSPSDGACGHLRKGVMLDDEITLPAEVTIVDEPEWLWPRTPAIRHRLNVPTHWLQITLTEGRNRQVRRMTAAVGLPTLRLIRTHIGQYSLWVNDELLNNGQFVTIDATPAPPSLTRRSTPDELKARYAKKRPVKPAAAHPKKGSDKPARANAESPLSADPRLMNDRQLYSPGRKTGKPSKPGKPRK
ncbi:MAG: pseudouridine synthase [Formosimonas sp.]|jgi:23S rRNA pseudouridine2457 synthase